MRQTVRFSFIAVAVIALGLAGCAGTPITTNLTASPPPDLPVSAELRDVPFFPQTDYYCGPAALATTLKESGLDVTPDELVRSLYTPGRQGTLQTEILTGARRLGRLAIPVDGMVGGLKEVADGNPVLVLLNLALEIRPQWHYAVLVGYDLNARTVMLRSGQVKRDVIDMKTLEYTWQRAEFWGVVVIRPEGPVPQSATMAAWLEAALGLERSSRQDAALTAYRTAMVKWPGETTPLIALANVMIAKGNWSEAENALLHAFALNEQDPIVLNNLANVYLEQSKCRQAETMAQAAVATGGPYLAISNDTLTAVRANPVCMVSR